MIKHLRIKRLLSFFMSVVVLVSMLPGMAFADLSMQGSRSADKTDLKLDEAFTINYCMNPAGTVTQRPKVDVSMVLDVSGSMSYKVSANSSLTRLQAMKNSSKIVTQKFRASNYGDRVSLVTFSDKAPVTSKDLTTNYNSIDTTIDSLTANGGTNISQGLIEGYYKIQNSTNTRYIILLTDGYANYYYDEKTKKNVNNREMAKSEAMKKADTIAAQNIPVYTIALASNDGSSDVDTDLLNYIATKTGGKAFTATNSAELDQAFTDITKLLSPTINSLVLSQPLPAGFVLAENDQSGAAIVNGVLTKTFPDIPYDSVASSKACMSVTLKFTGEAGTYDIPKATLSYKIDQQSSSLDIADPIRFTFKDDVIGLQGTASLAAQPTGDQLQNWDIKQAMTVRYDLTPIGKLIRSGTITNVKLTHLLPQDVAPAGTVASTKVQDRIELQFMPGNFSFGSGAFNPQNWTQSVDLVFAHAGTYSFAAQPGELTLAYRDNQGADHTIDLANALPQQVVVKVFLTDQWNNRYVGDGDGVVTRYSSGGSKQWDVDVSGSPMVSMAFATGSQDVVTANTFDNQSHELRMTPSVPTVVIKDRDGVTIADNDAAYKKGAGTLAVSGSATQLPANTNYYDEAFTKKFIDHYEYRLNGGSWTTAGNGSAYLDQSGENQSVEVRAVTKAISGTSSTHASDEAKRIVSLDAVAPHVGEISADFTGTPGTYKYTFNPSDLYDSHSGLRTNGNGQAVYELSGPNGNVQEKLLADNTFTATKDQIKQGMKLRATDKVGWSTEKQLTFPLDQTPPELQFNVESSVTIDGTVYTPVNDPAVQLKAVEDQSGIDSLDYTFNSDPSVHKQYAGNNMQEEISFQLSDKISDPSARYGKHTIVAQTVNTDDLTKDGTYSFIVTKAPEVTITTPTGTSQDVQIVARQNTVADDHVAIKKVSYRFKDTDDWIDINDIAGTNKTESKTVTYSGNAQGGRLTVYVKAVNTLDMETESQQAWDLDTTPPETGLNISPKRTTKDNEQHTALDSDLLITDSVNPALIITAAEDHSLVKEVFYKLDDGNWSGNLVTTVQQSQTFSRPTSHLSNGWHSVTVKSKNTVDLESQEHTYYFYVNAIPDVTIGFSDGSDPNSPANKPVTIAIANMDGVKNVPGAGGNPAVILSSMEFAVTDSASEPANESEWKKLGSTELTVSKENGAYVHIRFKQKFDSSDSKYKDIIFTKVQTSQPIYILFDQNRY